MFHSAKRRYRSGSPEVRAASEHERGGLRQRREKVRARGRITGGTLKPMTWAKALAFESVRVAVPRQLTKPSMIRRRLHHAGCRGAGGYRKIRRYFALAVELQQAGCIADTVQASAGKPEPGGAIRVRAREQTRRASARLGVTAARIGVCGIVARNQKVGSRVINHQIQRSTAPGSDGCNSDAVRLHTICSGPRQWAPDRLESVGSYRQGDLV